MNNILLTGVGGAIGAVLRYGTSIAVIYLMGKTKVVTGTVVANSVGCLLAGIWVGWSSAHGNVNDDWTFFLLAGLLGGYTTFSTFALEVFLLYKESFIDLLYYLIIHLIVAVGLAAIGFYTAAWLTGGLYA